MLGLPTVFDNVVAEINSFLFTESLFFQTARYTASEKKPDWGARYCCTSGGC